MNDQRLPAPHVAGGHCGAERSPAASSPLRGGKERPAPRPGVPLKDVMQRFSDTLDASLRQVSWMSPLGEERPYNPRSLHARYQARGGRRRCKVTPDHDVIYEYTTWGRAARPEPTRLLLRCPSETTRKRLDEGAVVRPAYRRQARG